MSGTTAGAILLGLSIAAALASWWAVAMFLSFAAILVLLFVPSDAAIDARRRNPLGAWQDYRARRRWR